MTVEPGFAKSIPGKNLVKHASHIGDNDNNSTRYLNFFIYLQSACSCPSAPAGFKGRAYDYDKKP